MASPHSNFPSAEADDPIACLQESARRGDWVLAEALAADLIRQPVPAGRVELGGYLDRLLHALAVAKASRADTAASLIRLNAAASFGRAGMEPEGRRQNFGDPADS